MNTLTSLIFQNSTAGLLALLGLVVPVAIHLWNRRPGQTVQVGSVRWLAATANRRLRNLRLEQLGLLLLRAAIVTGLALAVAGPLWQHFLPRQPARGVVLLAPEALRPDVLPALRSSIDSLRGRGFMLRLFAPGFEAVSAQAWGNPDSLAKLTAAFTALTPSAAQALPSSPASARADNYWDRARQAADSFPNQPLHLVSGTALRHFSGPRPALPAHLTWHPVPLPDSAVWVTGAALAGPDTLRLVVGTSREEATTFRVVQRKLPRTAGPLVVAGLPGLHYQPGQSGQLATVRQPGQSAVVVNSQPLRVLLYADALHAESARYVRAALQAAGLGLAQRLEIRSDSPATTFSEHTPPDWLFWLSEKPAPANWKAQVKRGAQLWQEASGAGAPVETESALAGVVAAPPLLVSRLDTTAKLSANTAVVWQDGTGRPVLTRQPNGTGSFYQLHTRLQPTWSGLPDSPALPELFLQLLRPAAPAVYATHDLRQLDTRQLTGSGPMNTAAPDSGKANLISAETASLRDTNPKGTATELRMWAVLAALVLFGLERWLADRRATTSSTPAL